MTEKKYIIFTDIKEFTYKNALLTNQQIEKMLHEFDSIIMNGAKKYNISIIKSIGDAYLCFSEDVHSAYEFSQYILDKTQIYDDNEKIEIKRIALRVAITYGDVTKNKAMNLDDYFGENINLAARIIDITPKGKIFCTQEVQKMLSKTEYFQDIGKYEFHGILYKTQLYTLMEMSEEDIGNLNSVNKSLLDECDTIVFRSACVSAILSAQPIPFIENFNIVGVHLYMIIKLSQKLERGLTLRSSSQVFKEVISPMGFSYFGLQGGNTLVKFLLPGIGGYLFSPLSFAMTYALGKIYTAYFLYNIGGETLTAGEIKEMFLKQKDIGKSLAKKEKINILKTGKKFYKDVLRIRQKSGYSDIQKDLLKMLKSKK